MKKTIDYSRVLAVGDIHGMYEKLIVLMDKIRLNSEKDLLIFLGDYIDRGQDSVKCLQYVYDLQQSFPDSVVCLLGNHEAMMTSFIMQKHRNYKNLIADYADVWLDNGGFETYEQLNELDTEKKEKRLQWASNLPITFQYQNFFFCHAGVDPSVPLERQTEFDMLWRRKNWWDQYKGEKTIVAGHTPVQTLQKKTGLLRRTHKPLFLPNNVIMCDTGAYMEGGKLSCIDVLSEKVWLS